MHSDETISHETIGYETIRVETAHRITTITLNRPERLNAWTALMAEEMRHAISEAGNNAASRCIVITGEGKGFCAGADMAGLQDTAGAGNSPKNAAANIAVVNFINAPGPQLDDHYPGRFAIFTIAPNQSSLP